MTDDYLIGHAKRVGLVGADASDETIERLLPTIWHDVDYESECIRDAGFVGHFRLSEARSADENAQPIGSFLQVPTDVARGIAETPYLYVD